MNLKYNFFEFHKLLLKFFYFKIIIYYKYKKKKNGKNKIISFLIYLKIKSITFIIKKIKYPGFY